MIFIFKLWGEENLNIRDQWDIRMRQYLGARYDAQDGAFDWDLSMKLYELKATMITKTEYFRFRKMGVAFSPFDEEHHETANKTICSSKVMKDKRGDKNAYRGYWVRCTSQYFSPLNGIFNWVMFLLTLIFECQLLKTAQEIDIPNQKEPNKNRKFGKNRCQKLHVS